MKHPHPTDSWDPQWHRWIAEADARAEQRRIALNGRESFGETQPPEGIGIAFGCFSGAICPIVLVDCVRVAINQKEQKMSLTAIETQAAQTLGLTTEKMVAAKAWDGKLGVMGKSPFVDANNDVVALGTCCESGSMSHLLNHRDSIDTEIARRNSSGDSSHSHRVRFAK